MSKEFTPIGELGKKVGEKVDLRGWIHRTRSGKDMTFIVLRDSTGTVQCVIKEGAKGFPDAQAALRESSLTLVGTVHKDPRAPTGVEVRVSELKIVGPAEAYPLKEGTNPEVLLDKRHLTIRSRKITMTLQVRSAILGAIHEFFRQRGFYEVQSPSITKMACEGGSTLFKVDYFGEEAYLSQSWQLHAEAGVHALEKLYCVAPAFRAEKSRTRQHLAEYWTAEAEMAWCTHEESLRLQEEMITHVVQTVLKKHKKELEELGADITKLEKVKAPFRRVSYREVLDMLKKDGIRMEWGDDLTGTQEKALSKHFQKPFFITDWPKEAKAFYMLENPKDPKTVLCADLEAPDGFGELIGGSARETDVKKLLANLKREKADPKPYEWYLEVRKFGSVPHCGFGLGIERLTMWICNLDHIRDAIEFPRTINRVYP